MHQTELLPHSTAMEQVRTAPISHDRLFKELFKAFYSSLLALFCPGWAQRLKPGARFLDKEILPQEQRGEGEADLLAVMQELPEDPLLPGLAAGLALPEVLLHTEIQEGRSARPMDERMYEYNHGFHQVYKLPVMSLLCWFGPGRQGISDAIYERTALGQWTVRFRYRQVGIRSLSATTYLEADNPLGYALAARMNPDGLPSWELRARCEDRIAKAPGLTAKERYLLVNCVRTYLVLSTEEQLRYEALRDRPEYREVKTMELTWDEKMWYAAEQRGMLAGELAGEKRGRAEMLVDSIREFWEVRFGGMTAQQKERLGRIKDIDQLLRVRGVLYRAHDVGEAEASLLNT